jgi:hypothetical protein
MRRTFLCVTVILVASCDKPAQQIDPAANSKEGKERYIAKEPKDVTAEQKEEFLQLLPTLPHKGEFFTKEGIKKAKPYLPVLLALTPVDLPSFDPYPFAALSRGLCDRKKNRDFAVKHFGQIGHPMLKLFWASILFKDKSASPQIVEYLRKDLDSEEQTATLKVITGPHFATFKKRVKEKMEQGPSKGKEGPSP